MVDLGPLLNRRKEPGPRLMFVIDLSSWGLPAISAILAVASGWAALDGYDHWAAVLGIAAGVIGAAGVLASNWSSRIRDRRIEAANSLAWMGVGMVESAQRNSPQI